MLKKLLITFTLILVSVPINASILDRLEGQHPFYFNDIFDRSLYDLSSANKYDDAHESQGPLKESLDRQLARLEARKLRAVNSKIIKEIDDYVTEISQFDVKKMAHTAAKSTLAGVASGGVLKVVAQTSTAAVGGVAVGVGYAAVDVAVDHFLKEDPEIKKARILKKRILTAIKNEELNNLEKIYITARFERDLPGDYQRSIESALLRARKDPGYNRKFDVKSFVNDILALPTTVILPRGCSEDLDASAFNAYRKKFLDDIFSENDAAQNCAIRLNSPKYSADVKIKLKSLMGNLCKFTYEGHRSKGVPVRRAALFLGEPGCGKTTAAQLICKELGFPSYEFILVKEKDFANSVIHGQASNSFEEGKPSKYSSALLSQNSEGKRGKNVILLMDDIDQCFKLQGLVAFLMRLFDPHTTTYNDDYFGISNIDWSQIFIIATVNTDLRGEPEFAALLDRCYFIEFLGPSREKLKETLRNFLTDDKFELSSVFGDDRKQWPKIRADIASYIIDHHDIKDDRQRQNRADDLLECEPNQWDNCANRW